MVTRKKREKAGKRAKLPQGWTDGRRAKAGSDRSRQRAQQQEEATAEKAAGELLGAFSAGDAATHLRALIVAEGRRLAAAGGRMTMGQRRLLMGSMASMVEKLGKVTGESLEISPDRLVRVPAFRVVLGRLLEALKPFPAASRAVVVALKVPT